MPRILIILAAIIAAAMLLPALDTPPSNQDEQYRRFRQALASVNNASVWEASRDGQGLTLSNTKDGRMLRIEGGADDSRVTLSYGVYRTYFSKGVCVYSCEGVSPDEWNALYNSIRDLAGKEKFAALSP